MDHNNLEMFRRAGLDITLLDIGVDTRIKPTPGFMDETPCGVCPSCRQVFAIGRGITEDERLKSIFELHVSLCDGTCANTLAKMMVAELAP